MENTSFRSLFLFAAILLPRLALATPLVISDIDDTLKITQVRDPVRLALSAFEVDRAFMGMQPILKGMADGGAKIAYISSAPEKLATTLHQGFLDAHKFPAGELVLRGSGAEKISFKVNAIDRQIRAHKPSSLVLFGDNGEFDPEIFAQVRKLHPKLPIQSFVHTVYRKAVVPVKYSKQNMPYATAVEPAYRLESMGLLSAASRKKVEAEVELGIETDAQNEFIRSQVFPVWTDCGTPINAYLSSIPKKWRGKIMEGCARGRLNSAASDLPDPCDL